MSKINMLGAIAGDVIGSAYEFDNTKDKDFKIYTEKTRFTDDTVMTLAVANWLLEDKTYNPSNLINTMQKFGKEYPMAGYGRNFRNWLFNENPQPYNSWGNGSAMRVSPVGLYAQSLNEALMLAAITASVSHNHPEGIKGAQAIASAIYLCKTGFEKKDIKLYVKNTFGYNLDRTTEEIRPDYKFDVSCQSSVPEAIICFLEGESFEEVVRLAVSLGGDSDTIACMAGAIAQCMYPIPEDIAYMCDGILTPDLRKVKEEFCWYVNLGEN